MEKGTTWKKKKRERERESTAIVMVKECRKV